MVVIRGIVKRKRSGIANENASRNSRARITNQGLLPGIPDDITMAKILSKLSWPMLRTFAVVSRGWLEALLNGKIFEARVSAKSTETMFVYCAGGAEDPQFALYSVQDNSVYSLPPIPGINSSTSVKFTYTSVNGRLYVFGCAKSEITSQIETWVPLKLYTYEYDLARPGGWRQRANPEFLGIPSESAVMNGRIFVHDRTSSFALYDPDVDIWSPIIRSSPVDGDLLSPIMSYVHGPHQEALAGAGIEENLVYHYGIIYDFFGSIEWITNFFVHVPSCMGPFFSFPWSFRTKSAKQEVKSGRGIAVAVIGGKFLKLTRQHIDAYDSHTNTWTPLHFEGPFEFLDSDSTPEGSMASAPRAVDVAVARVQNEMYSVVERLDYRVGPVSFNQKLFLMKSEIPDQGNERREYSTNQQNVALGRWKQLKCSVPLFQGFLSCPVQL